MSDYIERELALRIIIQKQKELCPLGTYGKKYVDGYDREKFDDWQEIIDGIESVPAADVEEVKYGKWNGWHGDKLVDIDDNGDDMYRHYHYNTCSECGRGNAIKSAYCPNCGAKMGAEG